MAGVRLEQGDAVVTHDGIQHKITKIENSADGTYSWIYLDNKHDRKWAYCIEKVCINGYDNNSVVRYFWRVNDYAIYPINIRSCTVEKQDCSRTLHDIQSALTKKIQAISSTIQSHLDSDSKDVTIEFLRNLSAEAKGLCEAQEIVVNKLKELTKEDNNA